MKKIILFLALSIYSNSFTQEIKVSGTQQFWAGGICCSSGVNYNLTLTFTSNKDDIKLEVDSIILDKTLFTSKDLKIQKINKGWNISFSIFNDQSKTNIISERKMIELPDEIIFRIQRKRQVLKIEKMIELPYLAYP